MKNVTQIQLNVRMENKILKICVKVLYVRLF